MSTSDHKNTVHTYLVDDSEVNYVCMFCRSPIGLRSSVQFVGNNNYVYCCQKHVGRERISRWGDRPDDLYDCNGCGKFIGPSKNVQGFDKHRRVYCSSECEGKAFMHASRDWDDRDDY